MVMGYVIHRNDHGGPVAWISALAPWHHVFKDTLYATQEMLGDAAAVSSSEQMKLPVLCGSLLSQDLPNIRVVGTQLENCCVTMRPPHCKHE